LIAWSNLFSNRLFTPAQPAGAGTAVLERLLDLLQLGLLLVEQLKPIRLAPRRILERGCRLRD